MKCAICSQKVGETFLKKRLGTQIRKSGKRYDVCSNCQRTLITKDVILSKL